MDAEAAAFVVDRIDVARMALLEARQTVEKYSQPHDVEVMRLLEDILGRVEQLDSTVRSGSYPS